MNKNYIGRFPKYDSIERQIDIIYQNVQKHATNYEKYQYLNNVYQVNADLFFKVVEKNILELLPIIYTPTIADVVMNYSKDNIFTSNAVFLDINKPNDIRHSLFNGAKKRDVRIMIITDGEGVLGIGDWGVHGVAISTGKSSVYTVASNLNPKHILPIVIDAGTNNEKLLNDPNYVGNRHKRVDSDTLRAFVKRFVWIANDVFPNVLFHWEDFGRNNAATILEEYQDKILTFNDDIQGTGVMIVSTMRAAEKVTKVDLKDHKYVIFGGGTAGIGIAEQLVSELVIEGLTLEEARSKFYIVDRFGLVTKTTEETTAGQRRFARCEKEFLNKKMTLTDVVRKIKPTVLIGTSGQAGAFTKEIIEEMAKHAERPVIMPISNPTHMCEAKASDIIEWTNGKALVVTGSPSKPVNYNGITYYIGQANNALLYPGLGLGLVASKARKVTDEILSAAANAMLKLQDLEKEGSAILPPVTKLREASIEVAKAVYAKVKELGLANEVSEDAEETISQYLYEK